MEIENKKQELFIKKSRQMSARFLHKMEELTGAPSGMEPFFEVLRNVYIEQNSVKKDKMCIGTFCMMVPQELIYAAGAMPIKLCSGNYTAFFVGDDIVPRDACPLVKAVMGYCKMETMPIYQDCELMVVPITCDCKKKMAGMLKEKVDTYAMHIPVARENDEDYEMCINEFYSLIKNLEEKTGEKVTYDSLLSSIQMVNNAQYEYSRFIEFKRGERALVRGTHVMAMMNALSYMPIDIWTDHLCRLNDELEEKLKAKEYITKTNRPRMLITGSPIVFPNIKIPLLIEEMGGSLVADETCMGERFLYDPTVIVDESFDGLVRSLANRYIRASTCPTFADNRQRLYRIKQMIKDHKVQGVVYHVLRGCLVYDYEYLKMEEEMGKIGIPIIRVESDYNEEDIEQLRIRIEAFIELIKLRKQSDSKSNNVKETIQSKKTKKRWYKKYE